MPPVSEYVRTLSKGSLLSVITLASKVPVTVALVTFKDVAVILPVIVALVDVNAPVCETLKGAEAGVELPA